MDKKIKIQVESKQLAEFIEIPYYFEAKIHILIKDKMLVWRSFYFENSFDN